MIGDSPPIEDVFALISPRLCAPLHHCMPLDPPKHLSVFPLAHPSVSHTHAAAVRTFLAIQYPLPPYSVHSNITLIHTRKRTPRARALTGDEGLSSPSD